MHSWRHTRFIQSLILCGLSAIVLGARSLFNAETEIAAQEKATTERGRDNLQLFEEGTDEADYEADQGQWQGGDDGDWQQGDWQQGGDDGDWQQGGDDGDWQQGGNDGDWQQGGGDGDWQQGGDEGGWQSDYGAQGGGDGPYEEPLEQPVTYGGGDFTEAPMEGDVVPTGPGPEAACSAHPGCSGLTGNCCPTAEGALLGCCGATIKEQSNPQVRGRGSTRRGNQRNSQRNNGNQRNSQRNNGKRNTQESPKFGTPKKVKCQNGRPVTLRPFDPSSAAIPMLRELLKVRRHRQLGRGGDTGEFPKYGDIGLVAAWEVDNPMIRKKYKDAEGKIFTNNMKQAKVPATGNITNIPGTSAGPLKTNLNERYFFHGTKPDFVELIACVGLKEGGGLFGQGVYLADAPEKFDQYTTYPEPEERGNTLLKRLGGQPIEPPRGELFYAFVVRGLLGHTFEGNCNCNGKTCANQSTTKCNRCGLVEQFGTGVKLKSRFRPKIVQPAPETRKGARGYVPDKVTQDWAYNSLCVENKLKTCIQRFNECIVPKGSNRAQVEILFAYERCKGKSVKGRCKQAVSRGKTKSAKQAATGTSRGTVKAQGKRSLARHGGGSRGKGRGKGKGPKKQAGGARGSRRTGRGSGRK